MVSIRVDYIITVFLLKIAVKYSNRLFIVLVIQIHYLQSGTGDDSDTVPLMPIECLEVIKAHSRRLLVVYSYCQCLIIGRFPSYAFIRNFILLA